MPALLDEQDQEDIVRQYGGTVQGQSMAATPQPSAAEVQQTDELLKQYGGVVGEPEKSDDPAASLRAFDLAQDARVPGAFGFQQPFTGAGLTPEKAELFKQSIQQPSVMDKPQSTGEEIWQKGIVNPLKDFASSGVQAAGNVNHMLGNLFQGMDVYASMNGMRPGEFYQHAADWFRRQEEAQTQTAAELAGGRKDFPSTFNRTLGGAVFNTPTYAVAGSTLGPTAGMAAMGALENADQGTGATVKGALEGALVGKFTHLMGPAGRTMRVPAIVAFTYAQQKSHGADDETAWANALAMGGMSFPGKGGPGFREMVKNIPNAPEALGEAIRDKTQFKTTLNPVQQSARDYMLEERVPLRASQITGNRYLQAHEASIAHTPLGAQGAADFGLAQQEAIQGKAEQLAGEVHPERVTEYEGGKAAGDALDQQIGELAMRGNDAYDKAWEHAGKPEHTESVEVGRKPVLDEDGNPTGKTKPVMRDVNMPVDVRFMKEFAKEELPTYKHGLSRADRAASKAYSILTEIAKGDGFITAKQAEAALSGLKSESMKAESKDLRNVAEGTAAALIPELQKRIDAAVAKTGQEAVEGLQSGRELHRQKMEIAEIADKLREEPVEAFRQLTRGHDAGIDYASKIAERAPGVVPRLARAWLDSLFDLATREGGWTRARTVFNAWENLGDKTKALWFPNQDQRQALDRFFFAGKMIGEPINPSGTAMVQAAQKAGYNPIRWAQGFVGSKLLFTPKGIQFLTGVLQDPPRSASDTAKVKAQAAKVFGPPTKEPPEEPPEGPGTPPQGPEDGGPPAGGGGAAPAEGPGERLFSLDELAENWHSKPFSDLSPAEQTKIRNLRDQVNVDLAAGFGEHEPAAETLKSAAGPSLQDQLQTLGEEALERVKKSGTFQGRTLPSLFPAEVTRDMITWGAARIANGAMEFSKWSRAMIADAKDISPEAEKKVRGMLPELWKQAKKEYEHHANTLGAKNIADLPKIMEYYRAGKEGKDWYKFVKPALHPLFGENTDLFLKMMAATSPNTKVVQNVRNAVKAYRQFLMGEQFTGMPAHVDNLNRAVAGVKMSGPKVGAFGPNLLGNFTPITVDLWMARAILGRETVTPLQSKLVDYMTSQAAKKVGLEPAEMQAAVWTGIKKLTKSKDTAAPPEVIVEEYLAKNPDVRKLFEESLKMGQEHFRGLQSKQAPAKPPRN